MPYRATTIASTVTLALLVAACTTSTITPPPGDGGPPVDSGSTDASATCAAPGKATPGPADTHCQGQPPQPVDVPSCHPDAGGDDGGSGDDGGGASCPYGDTMYGQSSDDDDCKYKVSWTSDPICESAAGVQFTVTVKSNVDDSPVTGVPGGLIVEAFIPTSLDASCDNQSTHPSPGTANLIEVSAGSGIYRGPVVFDAPGEWTVRFHVHEECADLLPTSPHGHAAYHVTVP
jgi:hypothetical protein